MHLLTKEGKWVASDADDMKVHAIHIYDAQGNIAYIETHKVSKYVSTKHLADGLYMVRLITDKSIVLTRRLIIAR